jgi:hypothetical protein
MGGLEDIWLRSGVLPSSTPMVSKEYIMFGEDEEGRGISEGLVMVSRIVTLMCVALIKPFYFF